MLDHSRHCLTCGYNLAGLASLRCPECGRTFDPHDAKTFARSDRPTAAGAWRLAMLMAVMAMLIISSPWMACRQLRIGGDAALAAWAALSSAAVTIAAAAWLPRRTAWLAALIPVPACIIVTVQAWEFRLYASLLAGPSGIVMGAVAAAILRSGHASTSSRADRT